MNLTLSIDERTVQKAREVAASMGMSLNQAIRLYLEELAGKSSTEDDIEELRSLSQSSGGHRKGWKFNREEIHERS